MSTSSWQGSAPDPEAHDAVRSVALDYIEGWYLGDSHRMDRALHGDLIKRTPRPDAVSGEDLRTVSKARMVDLTRSSGGRDVADPAIRVVVDDVSDDIASARTYSADFVDFLHLVKLPDGWKIAHALFRQRT